MQKIMLILALVFSTRAIAANGVKTYAMSAEKIAAATRWQDTDSGFNFKVEFDGDTLADVGGLPAAPPFRFRWISGEVNFDAEVLPRANGYVVRVQTSAPSSFEKIIAGLGDAMKEVGSDYTVHYVQVPKPLGQPPQLDEALFAPQTMRMRFRDGSIAKNFVLRISDLEKSMQGAFQSQVFDFHVKLDEDLLRDTGLVIEQPAPFTVEADGLILRVKIVASSNGYSLIAEANRKTDRATVLAALREPLGKISPLRLVFKGHPPLPAERVKTYPLLAKDLSSAVIANNLVFTFHVLKDNDNVADVGLVASTPVKFSTFDDGINYAVEIRALPNGYELVATADRESSIPRVVQAMDKLFADNSAFQVKYAHIPRILRGPADFDLFFANICEAQLDSDGNAAKYLARLKSLPKPKRED